MAEGDRLLQDLHLRPARHHRQPGRRRDGAAAATVVRHDGDDSYLVVAADKGTATFSDIANGVAAGLRLLARRRVRLRRLGRLRPQGDGHHRPRRLGLGAAALPRAGHRLPDRGLHLRRHRRHVRRRLRQRHALLRAHPAGGRLRPPRHLPRPDTRRRRRRTPSASGSSSCRARRWQDYDTSPDLRGRRRLPAHGQVDPADAAGARRRSASTTASTAMTPAELMQAILLAPVDLLWNGGIGTYVKARGGDQRRRRRQGQRRASASTAASCAPGASARAATSGSPSAAGSSTPAGRDGRAAGSTPTSSTTPPASTPPTTRSTSRSCSTGWCADGDLTGKQRNELLASMTDEVADAGAARQLRAEPRAGQRRRASAAALLHVHEDWMRRLERRRPAQPRAGGAADPPRGRRPARARRGPDRARSCRCCWPTPRSCWPTS